MKLQNKSYSEQFEELGKKAFAHIKEIIAKTEGKTIHLDGKYNLTIDADNGYTYNLKAKTIKLVNDSVAIFSSEDEKEIAELIDFPNSDGFYPEDAWFEGSVWIAEWTVLFEIFDEIIERFDTDYR